MKRKQRRRNEIRHLIDRVERDLAHAEKTLAELAGPDFKNLYDARGEWNPNATLTKDDHWRWGFFVSKRETLTRILVELKTIHWDQMGPVGAEEVDR